MTSKPSTNTSNARRVNANTHRNRSPETAKKLGKLHPHNPHQGRYDFALLTRALPELAKHTITNPKGEPTINFSDSEAVRVLNQALLAHYYGVKFWDIPEGYLCPPIPGRADYIHYIADLLAQTTHVNDDNTPPTGKRFTPLILVPVPVPFIRLSVAKAMVGALPRAILTLFQSIPPR